jgi:cephalosporin hydroxylase
MRQLLKNLAQLLPPVREHYERVQALVNELQEFKTRFSVSRLGNFFPDVREAHLTHDEKRLLDQFHDLYYRLGQRGQYTNTNLAFWLGYPSLKCPLDLWIYHELICKIQPEFIIETGTASAGSALFLASMCDLIDHGKVITIDVDERPGERRPVHPRLTYIIGSSTDEAVIDRVREVLTGKSCGMVILDSDHRKDHVLGEMRAYADFVPVGGYLIVEDTNINGHPTYPDFGPGPMEAVKEFLAETDTFQVDKACERFLLTMNPSGYLRRCK